MSQYAADDFSAIAAKLREIEGRGKGEAPAQSAATKKIKSMCLGCSGSGWVRPVRTWRVCQECGNPEGRPQP
jgi:hypothetical protein